MGASPDRGEQAGPGECARAQGSRRAQGACWENRMLRRNTGVELIATTNIPRYCTLRTRFGRAMLDDTILAICCLACAPHSTTFSEPTGQRGAPDE
mgnify:CR=1 FL=1